MRDFTPVFDAMIQEYGIYTALVYGRIWRYCQGQREECFASQAKIGRETGMSRKKVNEAIGTLIDTGWLTSTPRGGGHRYTYKLTDRKTIVTESDNGIVTESDNDCNLEAHPPLREKIRKNLKEGATAQGSHEAIQAFRKATHRYPAKSWYDRIVDTVTDIEKWQQVCMEWVGKGWNPMNIAGMLDVYQNGWKGGNGSSEPKGYQAIREYLQEKGTTGGN